MRVTNKADRNPQKLPPVMYARMDADNAAQFGISWLWFPVSTANGPSRWNTHGHRPCQPITNKPLSHPGSAGLSD